MCVCVGGGQGLNFASSSVVGHNIYLVVKIFHQDNMPVIGIPS